MSRDGCARGQASAVGAVFITMVFILLAVLVSRQIQVQTEVQRIASEVLEARRSEGALSLKVNDTYTSNSAGVAVAEEGQGTCDPAALLREDGYYCTFNAVNIGGTYVLKLNLSAQSVPPTLLNTTCRMLLYSNATLQASLYEKVNASLALLQTFTLPNATWTRFSVGSKTPSYVLLAQSQSPFQLKLDYLGYTYTVYNSTGFYAIVANGGPGHAYIYAVWAVTSEAPTGRIAVNRLLEPGGSVTVSVPIPSYNVSELRVATSTRVYIYKVRASLPPTGGAPPPGGAPPGAFAKFIIVSYNTTVIGTVGSSIRLVTSVKNVGNASGTVTVEVYDQAGSLVGSASLSLSPGATGTATITATLPASRGTYTWVVKAYNNATGSVDDQKTIQVVVKDLYLYSRGALTYTPFETPPSGWTNIGGNWWIVSGVGVGGTSALQGTDNQQGPGKESVYYWQNSIASYTSLQAVVQLPGFTTGGDDYRGFALLQGTSDSSYLYEVSVYSGKNSPPQLIIRSWTGKWALLASQSVPSSTLYTLYLSWSVSGNLNSLTAVLYDSSGSQVGSVTATDSSVRVGYIGLAVDDGQQVSFDNFVVSTSDPRYVVVSGLGSGWVVELRDSSGVVATASADASGVARLWVVAKPIVLNASITVKDQAGNTVVTKTFSEVVGGDTYTYG